MAIKPTLRKEGLGPVQEFIGTAYDIVKKVHDNLDTIIALDIDRLTLLEGKFSVIRDQVLLAEQNIVAMKLDIDTTYNTFISRANQVDLALADFDKTFLGTKAVDPIKNNSSGPLVEGNFYYNSTDKTVRFYTGSKWISPQTIAINAMETAVEKADIATNQATAAAQHSADALTSKNQAESYAASAQNSATSAAESESLASQYLNTIQTLFSDIELLAQNVEVSANTAQTYATDAANSATSASISEQEAEAHSLSAGSSASAAAASELNAKNSETAAATHETNAGQYAQAASAAETAATIAANAAESSEIAAALSEANALISANNAASSENKAAQIQATVETLLDQFGDLYLGAKTEDPTTDNDGNPLINGAFYLNTTDNVLKFYADGIWIEPEGIAIDAANSAQASADAAALSAISAQNSATSAQNSAATALSSEADAALSATQAQTSADNAAASELAAAASETNAANSASASQNSADRASDSADNAAISEANAANSASSASTSANTAISAKEGAVAAENKAEKWAEELTDIEVEPGKYSAKHHAEKSAESATASATSASEALASKNAAASSATAASTSELNAASSAAAASTSANNAATSESNALSYKNQAQTAASAAETSATNAGLSEAAAAVSESNAADSAAAADTARVAAESAKNSAQTAAATATTKANEASASADSAATSESNAAGSASAASSSASQALASKNKAEKWATELEDVEVEPGKYSAFHYAQKAEDSAFAANASEIAAETAETNAATSAANAAISESNAADSASSASQSAAAAVSAKNAAQLAESGAQAAEDNAATSASQAASSASQAASSAAAAQIAETNAGNYAAAAQTARDQALAAFDSFDDRYLGKKDEEPTVDNDGDPLVAGALYFDTTSGQMRVFDGSQWLSAYASLEGALLTANNLSDLSDVNIAKQNLGLDKVDNVSAASLRDRSTHTGTQAISTITGLQAALDGKAPTTHTHTIANVTGLQDELDGKSDVDHTHEISEVTGLQSALDGKVSTTGYNKTNWDTAYSWGDHAVEGYLKSVTWADVSGKPTSFTPSAHTHTIANVTGLQSALDGKSDTDHTHSFSELTAVPTTATRWPSWSEVTSKPSTFTPSAHTHTSANISDFTKATQDVVGGMVSSNTESGIAVTYDDENGKLNFNVNDPTITLTGDVSGSAKMTNLGNVSISVTVADDSHNHTIANVDGLQTALDGKAASSHTHTIANISGLQTALDGKSEVGHSHEIDDIEGLQTALDGKAATSHAHAWGDISGKPTTATRWPTWSEVTSKPTSFTPSAHTHTIGNITGLQAALDGKISSSEKGSANGVATLDSTGKVPNSQLPSFVDDVLEYETLSAFPTTGEKGKIYVAIDSGAVYRWTGTTYIRINDSVSSADQATKLATARTISLGGDASGSTSFDGSANVTISVTVKDDSHNHVIANVDGLQAALDGKAASSHTHTIGNVTGLQAALDGKASSSHSHSWADITSGVPVTATRWPTWSEVSSKPSTFTPSAHEHDAADITSGVIANDRLPASAKRGEISLANLQNETSSSLGFISGRRFMSALTWDNVSGKPANYTPSAHTHTWSEITGAPATATRWPSWSEVTSKPSLVETSRTITAGDGLSGGGNLSANRTLSVDSTVARYGTANGEVRNNSQLDARYALISSKNVSNASDSDTFVEETSSRLHLSVGSDSSVNYGSGPLLVSGSGESLTHRWLIMGTTQPRLFYKHRRGTTSSISTVEFYSTYNKPTKADVGLGNVPNWSGSTSTSLGTSNTVIPSQGAVKAYVDNGLAGKANTTGTYNIRATGTTKADVGLSGIPNTNGSTSNFLRGDGTWVTPPNTTYSVISTAEIDAGTASTARTISAARIKYITDKLAPASHSHSVGDITGLGSLATINTNSSTSNFLRGDGTWVTPPNTVTSVRANNTGTYRTGNINLIGGLNVTISEGSAGQFTISAIDTDTKYAAGTGLSLSGTTFSVDSSVARMNVSNTGSFTVTGDITAFSDARIKDNIQAIENALDKVHHLSGYTYTRTDLEDKKTRHTGVIAQEVQKVLPEAVMENEDGTLSVAYGNMVGLLIEAIKEQQKQIDALKPWYKKLYEWVKEKF